MAKRQVFYSFHYANDVMRVQQIRNIGALDDNKPVAANDWESIKLRGDNAIRGWIDDNMRYRSCVVVLIGEQTSNRRWVNYEIQRAWDTGKGLLGVYIHNLECPRSGRSRQGVNPFEKFDFRSRNGDKVIIPCKYPSAYDSYNDIRSNLEGWIEEAIQYVARF
jgi:hypothetical protein